MILAELAAVAFVEDENDALVLEALQALVEAILVGGVKGDAQFLDGRHDDFVCIVCAFQATYQRCCVSVLLDASLLEFVKLVTSLLVQVLAVYDKNAFLDIRIELE